MKTPEFCRQCDLHDGCPLEEEKACSQRGFNNILRFLSSATTSAESARYLEVATEIAAVTKRDSAVERGQCVKAQVDGVFGTMMKGGLVER